jgi:hypothetical protein
MRFTASRNDAPPLGYSCFSTFSSALSSRSEEPERGLDPFARVVADGGQGGDSGRDEHEHLDAATR